MSKIPKIVQSMILAYIIFLVISLNNEKIARNQN